MCGKVIPDHSCNGQNLNGLWKYAVTDQNTSRKNVSFEGEILVPFAIESSLSGVQKTFLPTDKLWYQREFTLDPSWKNKSAILHFGAVDYECQVWVNNRLVGTHKGGNNPFSFDITKYLKTRNLFPEGNNNLIRKVFGTRLYRAFGKLCGWKR